MFPSIILASKSPRRQQLLSYANIQYEVMVATGDEIIPENYTPAQAAIYIASQKIEQLELNGETRPILAADTIVVCGGEIFGKPANEVGAIKMLTKLSGTMHEVITGVCIKHKEKEISFYDKTNVYFNELSASDIAYYVHTARPFDKAGGYGIQEWIGYTGVKKIEGDYYNVMGLPISRVVQALRELY
jgi:septum formation protein